jgi:hypothetical protein
VPQNHKSTSSNINIYKQSPLPRSSHFNKSGICTFSSAMIASFPPLLPQLPNEFDHEDRFVRLPYDLRLLNEELPEEEAEAEEEEETLLLFLLCINAVCRFTTSGSCDKKLSCFTSSAASVCYYYCYYCRI